MHMRLLSPLMCCLLLFVAACSAEAPAEDPLFSGADLGGRNNNNVEDMGGEEPDAEAPVEGVRVATWNLRFFYDDVCELGICGDDTREPLPTTDEFQARALQIATFMKEIDADVFLLQEIETEACMEALRQHLGEEYNVWVLGEVRQAGSIDTAVVARSSMSARVFTHRQDPFVREDGQTRQFLREFLEVHLDWEGHELIVFSAHFRSRLNDDPVQRHAEATRAREIVDEVADDNPDAIIVFGGDLNDTPGSETLEILERGGKLVRVNAVLAPDDWTINSGGNLSALDHLFVPRNRGQVVEGSLDIVREGITRGGSDHALLMGEFAP